MKRYIFFSFFCLLILGCKHEAKNKAINTKQINTSKKNMDSLIITKIDSLQVPKSISIDGNFKDGLIWNDKTGKYIVFTIESKDSYKNNKIVHEFENSGDAELNAYCYKINTTKTELKWKIHDFVNDCPVDIVAEFVKNTLQVTDLNINGIAEIWTMYKTVCHGDVSPCDMKIIMYEGSQKYAMRGENKIQIGIDDNGKPLYAGGEYKIDTAFKSSPEIFRTHAKELWEANAMETWK